MVHFMQEAKHVDDFPRKEFRKHQEQREKEQERERYIYREGHSLVHKNFFPLDSR
jgi:hypothetical protein